MFYRMYGRGELLRHARADGLAANISHLAAAVIGALTNFTLLTSQGAVERLSLDVMNGFNKSIDLKKMSGLKGGMWQRNSARTGRWPQMKKDKHGIYAINDVHFMCTFGPEWPTPIEGWKMPASRDCSDTLGREAVLALAARIRVAAAMSATQANSWSSKDTALAEKTIAEDADAELARQYNEANAEKEAAEQHS